MILQHIFLWGDTVLFAELSRQICGVYKQRPCHILNRYFIIKIKIYYFFRIFRNIHDRPLTGALEQEREKSVYQADLLALCVFKARVK